MSSSDMQNDILKPPSATGLKALDRNVFKKEVKIPCLKISGSHVENVRPILKPFMLKMPKLKPINPGEETVVLLNPNKVAVWADIEEKAREKLTELGCTENSFDRVNIELNYDNWNADDILRAILPAGVEIARSFSKVGHIIHLNLRDHLLDFKQIIGEVLLDKTSNARTVVNKTTKIDNTYRNFSMELICGEEQMVTQVRENGTVFEFDFSKVYWNPRLSTEHQRVVDSLSSEDVLFDVFCGVGPFAIPCAKKKCRVFANDLNPNCYTWLNHNVKLNKVKDGNISTFNKDGADFITTDVKKELMCLAKNPEFCGKTHVAMNLPALALNFVKYFKNLFSFDEMSEDELQKVIPKIHVYFFVNGSNPEETAKEEFASCTGLYLSDDTMSYQYVRNVSPKKDMVKISFTPPVSFLIKSEKEGEESSDEPPPKRKCEDLP